VRAVSKSAMPCADIEPLLDPCVDGELLEDDRVLVHGHVAACEVCRGRLEAKGQLKALIAAAGRSVELPASLEARVRADLRAHRQGTLLRRTLGVVAVAALVGVATLGVLGRPSSAPVAEPSPVVARAALARHGLDLPVDVATPDPGRVQEFLAPRVGRLRVPRLDALGFGLSGARVVDVGNQRGAQLVYAGGFGQRLSVVAVPDPDGGLSRALDGGAVELEEGGLRARTFSAAGNVVSVVGELDHERLRQVSFEFER
jgi:anti-sigma factor RsiW